ncbi:MAG TPA: AAA family ATPase [Candidatus Acidoferrales bacterium]|nr:AAA family ATPase [Candidatus Acidoferrales bacterium]
MYQTHFRLERNPFEMSPDPYFFFATPQHREALAGLLYGITARKGFLVLTGEVGTGKSLVVQCLLDVLDRRRVVYAYVFNSLLSSDQFLHYIAEDLGVTAAPCPKNELLLRLSRHLIENHRKGLTTLVVIDEAHHLDAAVLEEVRLLSNLETPQGKLLQIALVGQPELDDKLETRELRQLKQRITLRFRLGGLSAGETRRYVQSRLRLAGEHSGALFTAEALEAVHRFSAGIPRLINTLCDNSMLTAYALGRRQVSADLIEEAAADLGLAPAAEARPRAAVAAAAALGPSGREPGGEHASPSASAHGDAGDIPMTCEAEHEPDL